MKLLLKGIAISMLAFFLNLALLSNVFCAQATSVSGATVSKTSTQESLLNQRLKLQKQVIRQRDYPASINIKSLPSFHDSRVLQGQKIFVPAASVQALTFDRRLHSPPIEGVPVTDWHDVLLDYVILNNYYSLPEGGPYGGSSMFYVIEIDFWTLSTGTYVEYPISFKLYLASMEFSDTGVATLYYTPVDLFVADGNARQLNGKLTIDVCSIRRWHCYPSWASEAVLTESGAFITPIRSDVPKSCGDEIAVDYSNGHPVEDSARNVSHNLMAADEFMTEFCVNTFGQSSTGKTLISGGIQLKFDVQALADGKHILLVSDADGSFYNFINHYSLLNLQMPPTGEAPRPVGLGLGEDLPQLKEVFHGYNTATHIWQFDDYRPQ